MENIPTVFAATDVERISALRKPYPGVPITLNLGNPVTLGFNFGQASRPQVLPIGSSIGMNIPNTRRFPPAAKDLQEILTNADSKMKKPVWEKRTMEEQSFDQVVY